MRNFSGRARRAPAAGFAGALGLSFIGLMLLAGCSGGAGHSSSSGAAAGPARGVAAPAAGEAGTANGPAGNTAAGGSAAAGNAASGNAASGNAASGNAASGNAASGNAASGNAASGNAQDGGTARGSGQQAPAARLAPSAEQLVYTAQLSVRARDVAAAVTRATAVVTDAGGYVSSEDLSTDPGHPDQSVATVELKIPVTVYATTLATLEGGTIGTELSLRQQAQDMTQQVADVGSQVASDRAAIAQLRALLSHAGSIGDLLDVQGQVNSEESDLESLEAQQNALNHETAYATVSLAVSGPVPPPAKPPAQPPGQLRGLTGGWHAFVRVLDWLVTAAGAVAPFAAVAALAWYVVYRLRRPRGATGGRPPGEHVTPGP